uniref:Putative secreted protein n=1 Tax=Anopheles marajoara TaxID=58244 RepID=A0A2M4C6S0_9DIPT
MVACFDFFFLLLSICATKLLHDARTHECTFHTPSRYAYSIRVVVVVLQQHVVLPISHRFKKENQNVRSTAVRRCHNYCVLGQVLLSPRSREKPCYCWRQQQWPDFREGCDRLAPGRHSTTQDTNTRNCCCCCR